MAHKLFVGGLVSTSDERLREVFTEAAAEAARKFDGLGVADSNPAGGGGSRDGGGLRGRDGGSGGRTVVDRRRQCRS